MNLWNLGSHQNLPFTHLISLVLWTPVKPRPSSQYHPFPCKELVTYSNDWTSFTCTIFLYSKQQRTPDHLILEKNRTRWWKNEGRRDNRRWWEITKYNISKQRLSTVNTFLPFPITYNFWTWLWLDKIDKTKYRWNTSILSI